MPYQVSLVFRTFTDILPCSSSSPMKIGIRYSALSGLPGSRRIEGITSNNSSSVNQHLTQPRSFKTGMSCYKYFLSLIKVQIKIHVYFPQSFQSFHGALPSSHNFSSFCFSLKVSIHCQKPL